LKLYLPIPIPPKTFSVDFLPIPKEPNHDSFLCSPVLGGIGIVNEGFYYLISLCPPKGLAAKALEILFMNWFFISLLLGFKAGEPLLLLYLLFVELEF